MEQNFQTSFIPKKPAATTDRVQAARPVGFLLILSILVLCAMVLASGGLYFYKSISEKNIAQMETDLNLARNRFEPSKINQLQILDKRLKASTEILSQHIAISPIFQELQDITMRTVRFTKFDYSFNGDTNSKVEVSMNGSAVGYRSIALQSDLFNQNEYFINPIFSSLSLDNKGNVLFNLDFSVDPSFINYKEILQKTDDTSIITDTIGETLQDIQDSSDILNTQIDTDLLDSEINSDISN